ncbi:MAG: S41 family peptidase [Bacteroidales bacterium]|nr:S41 family peptidase [Candidatus Liminaster caballi]
MKRILPILILAMLPVFRMMADVRTAVSDLQYTLLMADYRYFDTLNVDHLAETAIRSMLKELDPHTTYLTADEVKAMNEDLGGNFEGIGVRYQMERDTLLVISTVIGGPSEKVGIQAGDRIILVNDTTIAGVKMTTKDIQKRLRGAKGTKVKVSVMRDNEMIDFHITRDKIPVYSIDASYMVDKSVGYIKISRFATTTADELIKAMDELKAQGMTDLIIDLQGNGGGYLQIAVDMASEFLDHNNLVVYTEGLKDPRKNSFAKKHRPFGGRLVVLIDEESASASEIFTGAMQDWDRAVVVGRRSFGKGLVQMPVELPSGAMIRLTIAQYYTPCGRCIQKPYVKGEKDDYAKDIRQRYDRGEFFSADSIHFADSLIYHTNGGRKVYGGGGIMPDVFVPLDTTKISKTHRSLIARGTLNRFVLDYFRNNQKSLHRKYKDFESFNRSFTVSDHIMNDLFDAARKDSITISDTTFTASDIDLIKLQFKAYIANDMYENGSYSRIMNTRQNTFKAALDLILDEKRYSEILNNNR